MTKRKFIQRGSDTSATSIVCAVVFCLFSFIYLFFYQDDLLTMEQHVLSKGLTHYNRTVGAIILTLLFQLLQLGIDWGTQRCTKHPAQTYFIPFLLIAMLTDISPDIDKGYDMGKWIWLAPLLVIAYMAATYVSASLLANNDGPNRKSQFRIMWENLLIMATFMIFVCYTSNTDKIFHQRMHIDRLVSEGRYTEALSVGKTGAETDSSTTMLRAYALSKTNALGEKLFEYSLEGGSKALLPNGESVKAMISSDTAIYLNVARLMKQKMCPVKHMEWMQAHGHAKKALHDYLLCGYLMDKDIDKFAKEMAKDPRLTKGNLPKHFKEALVLYSHIRTAPVISYSSSVVDADYMDLQTIIRENPDKAKRKAMIQDSYGNTYWYYWLYSRK